MLLEETGNVYTKNYTKPELQNAVLLIFKAGGKYSFEVLMTFPQMLRLYDVIWDSDHQWRISNDLNGDGSELIHGTIPAFS
jgi:hypothetical protein